MESSLYTYVAALRLDDLPATTVESAAALVLDHFGCAILGMTLPWTSAVIAALAGAGDLAPSGDRPGAGGIRSEERSDEAGWRQPPGASSERSERYQQSPGAQVYGRPVPVPAGSAALVNGTATHGFDLDDTHLPTMSHPGCVVIPAAVAGAQVTGAGGRDLLAAVVAGYEVMGRIARATGLGFGEKGFHATGQVGPMGAAAAAARLAGLDAAGVAATVGLAASFGGGIKAFSAGSGNVKRLHAGRAAQAGLLAATLTRAGFDGPPAAVAGKFGFVPTFSTDPEPVYAHLTGGLGERHVVDEVYLKPYAACGAVHGAVAAAATLAPVGADEVERVVVGTSRRALAQNSNTDPTDVISAQYSTEYAVALALLGGATEPRRFLDVGTGADAEVRRLAARTVLRVDGEAERVYPDANGAVVEIVRKDGARRTARAAVSASTSRGWPVAEKKFRDVTAGLLAPDAQQRLVEAVAALAHGGGVERCLHAITEGTTHG
jgi:2-methylcitrate dehydratase PrpD